MENIIKIEPKVKDFLQNSVLLIIRLYLANIFLRSGILKLLSWDSTLFLFNEEYHVPLLPPDLAAVLGTFTEVSAGIGLLLGILSPIAALALFALSIIIEIFIYPNTTDHYFWILLLSVIMVFGGGRFSIDNLLGGLFRRVQKAQ